MTYQIIYSSNSAIPMQRDELQALLEAAQRANGAAGITGALVYMDGYFLQVLEGEMRTVQALMEKIARDFRHEGVTILQAAEIDHAVFSQWDMAYVSATAQQIAKWVGFNSMTRPTELFEDMRKDRQKSKQVTQQILAALSGAPESDSLGP